MPIAARLSAIDTAVTPEQLKRFSRALGQWHPLDEPLGVAVSGGPDSLALLLLAHALMGELCEAATVDHRLRSESLDEANMVAAVCRKLGVRHEVLTVEVPPGNLQAEARSARYAALDEWARRRFLTALATAHHADDQAETVLMRLNRGSGLAGLAGIRSATWQDSLCVVRPLLEWRKQELGEVVARAGLDPVRDPSNADPRFDRARMRAALAQADWLDSEAIAASARHAGDADRLLRLMESEELSGSVERVDDGFDYAPRRMGRGDGYELLHARALARAFFELLGVSPRFSEVRRLVDRLNVGEAASLCGYLVTGEGKSEQTLWRVRREPPRRTG